MKESRLFFGLAAVAFTAILCTALTSFLTGCEDASGTYALTVEPSYINIAPGSTATNSSQTFTVTAGTRELSLPLEWSVSNPNLGHIGASGGYSASYVANVNVHGDNTIYVKDQYDAEGVATVRQ